MALLAGFAEVEITPPLGTHKIGWLKEIVGAEVLSPLYARVAVFKTGTDSVAFVQLDTLFVAWPEVAAIRQGVKRAYGYLGVNVMVSATHNHAGPAVTHAGDVAKDERYAETLVARVIEAFGRALACLDPVEIGWGRCFEWRVAHNRRVVMRDGSVRTHGTFDDLDALYLEGPIDPEVAVLGVRDLEGNLQGAVVNFGCHPTHHGGDTAFDAGFPGVLASTLAHLGPAASLAIDNRGGRLYERPHVNIKILRACKDEVDLVPARSQKGHHATGGLLSFRALTIRIFSRCICPLRIISR